MIGPALFSLAIAAAGWYYMFYSHAASRLSPYEGQPLNTLRIRLRRIGGFFMFLLAVAVFALFFSIDSSGHHVTKPFFLLLLAILLLLSAVLVLALVDLRLTARLRRGRESRM